MHDFKATSSPEATAAFADEVAILHPAIDNLLAALAAWRFSNALRDDATSKARWPSRFESQSKTCALEPATSRTQSNGKNYS